ncbi:MAG: hypothetical protein LUD41_01215 [Phascolarctobacterium sp.]|nr:hypothetical protein [Phascolarctobacterium sp.]
MALINCPECGGLVSDMANFCPHCGYVLENPAAETIGGDSEAEIVTDSSANSDNSKSEIPVPETMTQLDEPHSHAIMGTTFVLFGILIVLLSFLGGVIGFIVIGLVGLIMLGAGADMLAKKQDGKCPYCGGNVSVPAGASAFKCPHCKQTSKKTDRFLTKIER